MSETDPAVPPRVLMCPSFVPLAEFHKDRRVRTDRKSYGFRFMIVMTTSAGPHLSIDVVPPWTLDPPGKD